MFLSWDMFLESSTLPCSCRVSAAAGCPYHPGVPHRRGSLRAPGLPSGVDGQVGSQPDPEAGFAAGAHTRHCVPVVIVTVLPGTASGPVTACWGCLRPLRLGGIPMSISLL